MGVPHLPQMVRSASSAGCMVRGPRSLDPGHCELASRYCVAVPRRASGRGVGGAQCGVLITIAARRAFGHGAEAKRRRSGGGLRS
eukprot:COSAG02_NODE_3690_length_6379_cov_2.751433_5_plen_85_part_00